MSDNFGKLVFTQEDIDKAEEERRASAFFADGVATNVVLMDIVETDEVGKFSGKPWTKHVYYFQREDGKEKEVFDFALKNAFDRTFKKKGAPELRIGAKLVISAFYDGQNDAGFDSYRYEVALAGSPTVIAPAPANPSIDPKLGF